MGYCIVSVNAHGHQHICGGVCNAHLREANDLAGQIPSPPRDCDAPYYICEHIEQPDEEILILRESKRVRHVLGQT